jgi:hypothetical protein
MREIFTNAEKVIVWLGKEEEHDEPAFLAFRQLSSHVNKYDEVDPIQGSVGGEMKRARLGQKAPRLHH